MSSNLTHAVVVASDPTANPIVTFSPGAGTALATSDFSMIAASRETRPKSGTHQVDLHGLEPSRRAALGSVLLAVIGTVLVYWLTPYGSGLSPDSVYYIAAARWALSGHGVASLDGGEPLTHFPPLYPLALAAAAWISRSDPLGAARWLNATLFAALLVLAGLLAARIGRRPLAGIAAALVLLVSRETVMLHAMAWSEPLAIMLGTAGLVLVARHIETRRARLLALSAIGLGLAALTRYAAVAYAITAAVGLLVLDPAPVRRRAGRAVALAALAAGPLVLWWVGSGARIGLADRTLDFHALSWWDFHKATTAILGWFAPLDLVSQAGAGVGLLLIAALASWAFRGADPRARTADPLPMLLLLLAGVYVGVLVACRMAVDPAILFDARMLAPAYIALVIAGAGLLTRWLSSRPTPPRAQMLLLAIGVTLVGTHATATARWGRTARADGLFYARRSVQQSTLLGRIRALPPGTRLWSNAPDVVYIHTGRCARWLPRRDKGKRGRPGASFGSEWRALLGQPEAYVAWFDGFAWRSYLPAESELADAPSVATVASLSHGTLYQIAASGDESAAVLAEPPCPPPATGRGPLTASGPRSRSQPQVPGPAIGWSQYGGDPGGMRYSPLADIDRSNVKQLELAWRWRTGERGSHAGPGAPLIAPGKFEATPLVMGDTLFLITPNHRAVALDAETGAQLWAFDPRARHDGEARQGHRFVHRGLAAWSNHGHRRLFYASRGRLYALDRATGTPAVEFGDSGVIDLLKATGWSGNPDHLDNTTPPAVYGDLVIVGSSVSDDVSYRGDPPGAVLAFDARSGRMRWIFRTIPEPGRPGYRSWLQGTDGAGHANVWAPMTVDTARGLLYLPVSAASNDYYGGRRHGANLFAESLVCLDARTGKQKWYFQTVHHGLWDYDLPGPPLLATIRREGRTQDIVAVAGKTGFLYVFDRVNGKPLWPIEERVVPASDVPGEVAFPTQPFPTKPAPFVRQGISEDDLVDFTPLLRDSIRALLRGARFGPLFTPPSVRGTVVMPGPIGGAAWGGPAYDPESQLLFVKGNNQPSLVYLAPPAAPNTEAGAGFTSLLNRGWRWPSPPISELDDPGRGRVAIDARELPIGKPPYGTVTAIDLATGEHRWQVPVGNWPELTEHPAVRNVKLPRVGAVGTSGPTVTRGGLVFVAGGSTSLHALDAATGEQLWEVPLGGRGEANPMTYRTRTGRQFIVIASSRSHGGELLAFALPRQ